MQLYKKLLLAIHLVILFYFLLFINLYYLGGIAHVPDSVAYIFMAKMFASGHLITKIPVSPASFDFFSGVLNVSGGKWLFQYPFGHPLLLTIGELIHFPNIIPPLIGTLTIFLLFLTAKKLFGEITAFFLLPLPFFSPFFLENSASFMSHSTSAFYLTISLYFLLKSLDSDKKILFSLFSGFGIGFMLNTRPLSAIAFLPVLFFLILFKQKKRKLDSLLSFIIGFLFLVILWCLYNIATTGYPYSSEYYSVNNWLFGIPKNSSLLSFISERFKNVTKLFNNFGPMIFNWPQLISYFFIFFPLIFGKRNFWDRIFFISLFTLPIAYFFYDGTFIMYGPRFWYEIFPFVFLLSARSFGILFNENKIITTSLIVILGLVSFLRFFSILPTQNPDIFSPLSINDLVGFNFTDTRIIKTVRSKNIHNSVILVDDCDNNWWCFGSVLDLNSPQLNTDIVFAKNLGDANNKVIKDYFKNKNFYTYNYENQVLKSY